MSKINYLEQGAPMPPSIGRCADLYRDVRDLRLAMEKEVEKVKARETEVKNYIIDNLAVGQDTGAAGLRYRAQLVSKVAYRIGSANEDAPDGGWGAFCSWIRKNDRFDMLQKRVSEKAADDFYAETGRVVPGLERVNVKDVSITKI